MAQALIDAAFAIVIERRRSAETQWGARNARQERALERLVDTVQVPSKDRFALGDSALGCGLAYLDFRPPEMHGARTGPILQRGWMP